jgi:tetratricopeptide (TPR) repeat protein
MDCPLSASEINSMRRVVLCLGFLIVTFFAYDQEVSKLIQKADGFYEIQDYNKAIKYYLKAVNLNSYSKESNLKCARCYDKLEQYDNADLYYSIIFKQSDSIDPALFLEYGELQMKLGRYEAARSYFVSYNNLIEKNDLRALRYIKSIEDNNKFYSDSSFLSIKRVSINSYGNDFNPVEFNNKLYFETNRTFVSDFPYLTSIDYSSINTGKLEDPKNIEGKEFSKFNGAGFAIKPNSNEIFFSKSSDESVKSKYVLMRSMIEDEGIKISKPERIEVDSFDYDILYPTFSRNGDKLIFASATPMGPGGLDLYIANKNSSGYSSPKPLNNLINTLSDENYPFLANDSILYFASKGQGGLGGYDIYYINLNQSSSLPINPGYPINSRFDDYGLSLGDSGLIGYFVSNRASDNTLSDIYSFKVKKIRTLGVVIDQQTGDNLKNVDIETIKAENKDSHIFLADNGHFTIDAEPGEEFNIVVRKEGYKEKEFHISTKNLSTSGLFEKNIGAFEIKSESSTNHLILVEKEIQPKNSTEFIAKIPVERSIVNNSGLKDSIKFRVQIAADKIPLDNSILMKKYTGNRGIFMYREDGWYKYAIGEFNSYFEAKTLLKQCGVRDAFIAAYSGTKKLKLMYAIRHVYVIPSMINAGSNHKKMNVEKEMMLYYKQDQFEPEKNELSKIDGLKEILLSDGSLFVEIEGYTDIQGSADYNYGLGEERAEYMRNYLIKNGIAADRITAISYGKSKITKQFKKNLNDSEYSNHRRTEIILYRR